MPSLFRASTLLLLLSGVATAQTNPGTIVLKNGDRITGSVLSIAGGNATIDTAAAGKIQIGASEIASIDSRIARFRPAQLQPGTFHDY